MYLNTSITGKGRNDKRKLVAEKDIRLNAKNECGYVALHCNLARIGPNRPTYVFLLSCEAVFPPFALAPYDESETIAVHRVSVYRISMR